MEVLYRHMKKKRLLGTTIIEVSRQNCVLLSRYDKMTVFVEEETVVDVVYLHFKKAFNMVFHNIIIAKLGKVRIDWIEYKTGERLVFFRD